MSPELFADVSHFKLNLCSPYYTIRRNECGKNSNQFEWYVEICELNIDEQHAK